MKPIISVIIPTFNRCELLKELVNSLKSQYLNHQLFEIIIINDGSTDDTEAYLKDVSKNIINLKYYNQNNRGPAAARNLGANLSRGKYLAFTDDDCITTPDWLLNISQTFKKFPILGIEGRTTTYKKEKTPLTHQIENEGGNPAVPTCNAAFLKKAFQNIGGFDESFPSAHNEDADLAWRLEKLGHIRYEASVHIIHPPRKEKFNKMINRMKILESEFLLFHKDPKTYKVKRNSSPWITIYKEVFFIHQLRNLKSVIGFFKKPQYLFSGILLIMIWWTDLIIRFPKYCKTEAELTNK